MNRSLLVPAILVATLVGPAAVSVPSITPVAYAQNGILTELYGNGVHAYYSHDYARAYDLLSRAIGGGLNDPRAYYFRGLTNIATGRPDEAEADMRVGAQLEATGNFGPLVGRALTRVQGTQRMQIELIRQQARLEHRAAAADRDRQRYSDAQEAEAQVLRTPPRPRTPPPLPGRPAAAAPAADAPTPFDDDAMAPGQPTVQSADALEDAMVDPFADDAAPAPAQAAPSEAPASDPFGAPPAGGDPFGAPPAGDDPFGAPPAGGDPFGGDPFGS